MIDDHPDDFEKPRIIRANGTPAAFSKRDAKFYLFIYLFGRAGSPITMKIITVYDC